MRSLADAGRNWPQGAAEFGAMHWCAFNETSGVLELDGEIALHWRLVEGRTLAWWTDDLGRWLGLAHVGLA